MRSAAAAIAWEFRQRHRWGLLGVAGLLLVIATLKLVVLHGERATLDDGESFAVVVIGPMTMTFTYFLAVFTFGFSGDLAARESMYPSRLFTLPVTTAALAGWPMLYGAATMIVLWFATRIFAVWPAGFHIPVIWPAVLTAVLLAWTQALTWLPYPLRGLRVIVAVFWLATIDAVVLLALHYRASEPVVVAILAPQLPLAYLVACYAVARARRGDLPDWSGAIARAAQRVDFRGHQRDDFRSPARAQAWLEWRRHGRTLPAWVGMLLPFELALLFAAGSSAALVFTILLAVLLTPPFMAAFTAASVHGQGTTAHNAYGLAPFDATRPLSTPALVVAKLRMTIWTTAVAWLLVLIAIPAALIWTDTWPVVSERLSALGGVIGTRRVVAVVLLTFAGAIASTWKQLVKGLYIGLTGRERLIKGSVFLTLAFLSVLGPLANWIHDNAAVRGAVWDALPLILTILVGIKMFAAAWSATALHRSGRSAQCSRSSASPPCWR